MTPMKLDAVVGAGGKVELTVPLPPGTPVQVIVRDPAADDFRDLMEAAQSSLGFWDNPTDDEDWNDHLQERLAALDRDGPDPRPWREVMDELRGRLRGRNRPA